MELTSVNIENAVYGLVGILTVIGVAFKAWRKATAGMSAAKYVDSTNDELLTNDQNIIKQLTTMRIQVEELKETLEILRKMSVKGSEQHFYIEQRLRSVERDILRVEGFTKENYKTLIKIEDRTSGNTT